MLAGDNARHLQKGTPGGRAVAFYRQVTRFGTSLICNSSKKRWINLAFICWTMCFFWDKEVGQWEKMPTSPR
jgi:hypothetical protein